MAVARSASKLKEYKRKRDFKQTKEPSGAVYTKKSKRLQFVIQKHEASHLHYDVRLEVDGVMKSWACPKGPSFDTSVKRLAVQVEDHPTSYNTFEGTIPEGQYGGGTVMVWDKGHYTVDELQKGDDPEEVMLKGIEKGKLAFTFHGQKLKGSFTLVRMKGFGKSTKPQWLLIKHKDEFANTGYDPVDKIAKSAMSKRTMQQIKEQGKVNADDQKAKKSKSKKSVGTSPTGSKKKISREEEEDGLDEIFIKPRDRDRQTHAIREGMKARQKIGKSRKSAVSSALKPMLVHKTSELLEGKDYIYEQKLDGVRLIAYVEGEQWTVISRLGNNKSSQFPELGASLIKLGKKAKGPLILDGELCAVNKKGRALGFQNLQGRIHLDDAEAVESEIKSTPVEFFVFDVLLFGECPMMEEPWSVRRRKLEALFKGMVSSKVKLNPYEKTSKKIRAKAIQEEWEGLIIKTVNSPYQAGVRSKHWLKWKLQRREELVIGGWTKPRGSRLHIGSLLLGYYDQEGAFIFAGHVGSGFTAKALNELSVIFKKIEIKKCPFSKVPATNEPARWVRPELLAEVKFHEWTSEGNLRHGTFLGIRDDKRAREIVDVKEDLVTTVKKTSKKVKTSNKKKKIKVSDLKSQTEEIKNGGAKDGAGELLLPEGSLRVTHLDKVVYPKPKKITKEDLLLYYNEMSPHILPWMEDRPLVMRRFPGGVTAKDFYQQSPDEDCPGRVVKLKGEDGESQRRLVGGDLVTLLYLIQMGCVSYDPWHSRIKNLGFPDYTIIDLDPIEGTKFATVRSVALDVLDNLEEKGFRYSMKLSGATGLHIYLPLPPKTKLEVGRIVAEIICTQVSESHKNATIERMVKRRPKASVYLDSQQNYLSKSVAGVWAARAKAGATVSTPISRKELEDGVLPKDFNIFNVVKEAEKRTKMWNDGMSEAIDIESLVP